jgi:cell division protein FtsI (penicillin-binding protein 3)
MADAGIAPAPAAPASIAKVKPSPIAGQVVTAALLTRENAAGSASGRQVNTSARSSAASLAEIQQSAVSPSLAPENSTSQKLPASGTVVLDVEEGGIEVPSFIGKNLRIAIEVAQDTGLDLDAVGSGVGREQSPPAGSHVAAGSRITVKFGR